MPLVCCVPVLSFSFSSVLFLKIFVVSSMTAIQRAHLLCVCVCACCAHTNVFIVYFFGALSILFYFFVLFLFFHLSLFLSLSLVLRVVQGVARVRGHRVH